MSFDYLAEQFATLAWGPWLVIFLVGSGIFFLIFSRLRPFRYLPHAFALLTGKYSKASDVGDVSHFKALTAALSGTIGLGNIAGVAVAIQLGGPGAIFWMWLTAIVGIATKFFTCTLSVMYRDVNPDGTTNAGPMYVIKNALPNYMLPLAYFFAIFGIIGCLPGFQSNQLVQISKDLYFPGVENFELIAGIFLAIITAIVVVGGLKRIANYQFGIKNGEMVEYWSNGMMFAQFLFKNDLENGKQIIYSRTGSINYTLSGIYVNGTKVASFTN